MCSAQRVDCQSDWPWKTHPCQLRNQSRCMSLLPELWHILWWARHFKEGDSDTIISSLAEDRAHKRETTLIKRSGTELMEILVQLHWKTNSFLVAVVPFKGSRVVPAAEKPEFNQGGLAAANQNLFLERCSCRVKFLNHFDKLENLTHTEHSIWKASWFKSTLEWITLCVS